MLFTWIPTEQGPPGNKQSSSIACVPRPVLEYGYGTRTHIFGAYFALDENNAYYA
jgi:hypothetical protein